MRKRLRLLCVEFYFLFLYGGIEKAEDVFLAGYSFFDSGDVALLGRKKTSPFSGIGK